ncbi:MAG: fumarylacetoacetase [Pseudomonadales bacterium]
MRINETHAPQLRSWVAAANAADCAFPIQNLPFGVVRRAGSKEAFRGAVAIGDCALDLAAVNASGVRPSTALRACTGTTLNALMALDHSHWSGLRKDLSSLLTAGDPAQMQIQRCLIPLAEVEHALPAQIGDYTDFYTSIHHARNIGKLFRPDNPLLPNYEWVPIGYHGRSSSIAVSGQQVPRPVGQVKPADAERPVVEPCSRLDYELELGLFVGTGNALGQSIGMAEAEQHLFGMCLLNDWSARDLQAWEYQPLGPFLGKNFASTISPWIVTTEALAPFRATFARGPEHPAPLPYLDSAENTAQGAFDIQLRVQLQTQTMRHAQRTPQTIAEGNYQGAYWTAAQLLVHHTVNGCNLRPGDLLGSGTISGADFGSEGALIERTKGGSEPLRLANGEHRRFLEDGDTVILSARCQRPGFASIGFGEAAGTITPAMPTA